MQATATLFVLGLAHDTDRIVSIYVAMPKVAKASIIWVAVTSIIAGIIELTFANGNTAWIVTSKNTLAYYTKECH